MTITVSRPREPSDEWSGPRRSQISKALDKLETILQHTQGDNPPDFDYRSNVEYGRRYTEGDPLLVSIRSVLDEETERRADEVTPSPSSRRSPDDTF